MNAMIFVLFTFVNILWEYLCYCLGRKRLQCIKNITIALVKENVICAKICQAMSVGINIITNEESSYLSQYTDTISYTQNEITNVKLIEDNIFNKLGKKIKIAHLPCKSGVVALAYKGIYDNDIPVIVKIKRVGILKKIQDGIQKIEYLIKICKNIPLINKLEVETIFFENKTDMLSQCDFNNEISNALKYKKNHDRLNFVKVPIIYTEITDIEPNIIVIEEIKGKKINELSDIEKPIYGKLLAKLIMKSALYDGFYHADLHAGNILFTGTKENPILGIFDFGIMGSLSDNAMEGFYMFFKSACLDKDYNNAARALTNWLISDTNKYDEISFINKKKLHDELVILTNDIFGSKKPLDISLITQLNKYLEKYNLSLSREFCKLLLSIAVSAGLVTNLCNGTINYMHAVNDAINTIISKEVNFLI